MKTLLFIQTGVLVLWLISVIKAIYDQHHQEGKERAEDVFKFPPDE